MKKLKFVAVALLSLMVFSGLVGLGFWQRNRGEEKQYLQTAFQSTLQAGARTWDGTQDLPKDKEWIAIEGKPLSGFEVLLDNRTFEGRVGYDVLLPVQLLSSEKVVWVNMGWLVAPLYRAERPTFPQWPEVLKIDGIVRYFFESTLLPNDLIEKDKRPFRIQRVHLGALAQTIPYPQLNFLVHSHTNKVQYGLKPSYKPINMTAEKHYAYQWQWWGLSLVWLIGVLVLWKKTR